MKLKLVAASLAVALLATGCQQSGSGGTIGGVGTKQAVGGLGGAALGGYLGSKVGQGKGQLAATAAGALAGLFIGSEVGKSLDRADQAYLNQSYSQAQSAPLNQPIQWNNPQSGNYGTVTPIRDGTTPSGQYCREFQQTIVVDGRAETGYGTACQQPDGSWKIVG